jgi:hypothetical protein
MVSVQEELQPNNKETENKLKAQKHLKNHSKWS